MKWSIVPRISLVALLSAGLQPAVSEEGALEAIGDERLERIERMSASDLTDAAERHIQHMRQVLSEVRGMLEDARVERDVVKLNCVNERLTHLRGLVRVSEESQRAMRQAISRNLLDEAQHEYTKIVVALDRVTQLREEAEECVGLLAFIVDEDVEVSMEVPPGLPDDVIDLTPIQPASVRSPVASTVE